MFISSSIRPSSLPQDVIIKQGSDDSGVTYNIDGLKGIFAERIEYALLSGKDSVIAPDQWQSLDDNPGIIDFEGIVELNHGWNYVFLRANGWKGVRVLDPLVVGAGDIYLVIGQSNATGSSDSYFISKDNDVYLGTIDDNELQWRRAHDPQVPGGGGSVWPLVGDLLSKNRERPIGFVNIAVGSTRVEHWLPGTDLHNSFIETLQLLLNNGGLKAILWHQGEANKGSEKDDYYTKLISIIGSSREIIPNIPWFVSVASYSNGSTGKGVTSAQKATWQLENVFPGPDTDSLQTDHRREDKVHFNGIGTEAAAQLWYEAISQAF